MKKFSIMLAAITVAAASTAYAQYEGDALRFSQSNYGASARIRGLGGAQIGLGGDISSMGGNPAGMGFFTRSEFSFTPEFNQTSASTQYLGQASKSNKGMLNLNQLGVAWYNPTTRNTGENTDKGLLSVVLGINYNRNNDFSAFYDYAGTANSGPSIRNFFSELANETGLAPNNNGFAGLPAMAYDSFLINYDGTYGLGTPSSNSNRINDTRTGSVSELNFNVAFNISNEFYIGGSLGLVNTRYMRNLNYMEKGTVNVDPNETDQVSNPSIHNYDLTYRTSQESKGSGINARIGMIFRPVSEFRIGATLQTPTWFTVEDIYTETVDNRLTKASFSRNYTNTPDEFPFTYNLRTPLKGSLGASYVIGGTALISADIDYIDYASMVFNRNNNNGDAATIASNNNAVKNLYKEAVNFRFGAEYKLDLISLRAGYGINGSAFQNDDNGDFATKTYSGGLGYRVKNYSIDLAYQYHDYKSSFTTYGLADGSEPIADAKTGKNNIFLTVGLRF
ncbi:hypothetical protein C7T94_11955 [Pedobacter yulinensis]|uniref:Hemin receptor n=1 Tax=Pedobacter yulinensis TaxID=2126353 RepID=A0A2T3HLJ1_9SPHI|nr:outer membrane protein transport protein [Pedobacter yulinensis]PST83289.1 hypothetical protein C7T94_11955 [Pedobacter yulinensis]